MGPRDRRRPRALSGAPVTATDGRQLDAFTQASRVGSLLEVARDEMLDRAARGEPVSWVASGNAGTVLHGWLAVVIKRDRDGHPQTWRVTRIGASDKARGWTTAQVTKAVAKAASMLDPDSPRCLRERARGLGPIFSHREGSARITVTVPGRP